MYSLNVIAALLFFGLTQAPLPRLADVEAKMSKLPGVEIISEVVSPSVVPVRFKISPKAAFWAMYPTSEDFVEGGKRTTWMPDRREYAVTASEEGNPLPVGFDAMWPGARTYRQVGESAAERFHEIDCVKIPCRGSGDYTIELFVERTSLIPRGTRVKLNGQVHEMFHKRVIVRPITAESLRFRKPSDARPAGKFDPTKSLIRPGTQLSLLKAKDANGKGHSLSSLTSDTSGLVLNFWFSSCTGCVAEMPYLVALKPKLDKAKIRLVGVNSIDGPEFARRTATLSKLSYPTLVGPGAANLTKQVGVAAYPVTLIVDKDRRVVDAIMGFDEARLLKALKIIGFK